MKLSYVFDNCLLLLSLCAWFCVWSLFCGVVLGVLSSLAIILAEEEIAGCFTLIVLRLSRLQGRIHDS